MVKVYDRDRWYFPDKNKYTIYDRDPDCTVMERERYVDGIVSGTWYKDTGKYKMYTEYNSNGQKQMVTCITYNNQLKSETMYRNGQISSQETFDDKGNYINLPEKGEFEISKADIDNRDGELRPVIIKLKVPADSQRVTIYYSPEKREHNMIGRVEYAVVEDIIDNNNNKLKSIKSDFDGLEYKIGEIVKAKHFNADPGNIHGPGISVSLTEEALKKTFDLNQKIINTRTNID